MVRAAPVRRHRSMRGLPTRLRRSRAAAPPPAADPAAAAVPAGLEPTDPTVPPEPGFRDRGRLRRRLRHLRRVRELGFRDLGGLVFDLHRFGRRGDELVAQKLQALAAVDRELRALERALHDQRPFHELREPGLAACPRCAAIHGSDARFCPSCGTSLRGPLAVGEVGDAPGGMLPGPSVPAVTAVAAAAPPAAAMPPAPVDVAATGGGTPVTATLAAESQPTEAIPVQDAPPADAAPDATAAPADATPAQDAEPAPDAGADDITVVQRPDDRQA